MRIELGQSVRLTYQGNGQRQLPPPKPVAPIIVRLGDRVGVALASVGVTPESWSRAKEAIGMPPGCGCAARKAWLNQLDERLGLGEKLAAVKAALRWQ